MHFNHFHFVCFIELLFFKLYVLILLKLLINFKLRNEEGPIRKEWKNNSHNSADNFNVKHAIKLRFTIII